MNPFDVFIQHLIKLLSENSSTLTTIVIALMGFLAYWRSTKQAKKHREEERKRMERIENEIKTPSIGLTELRADIAERAAIRNILKDLLESTHGNRACMFKFHNGTRYYTNKHQTKATCEVEVVQGANPVMALYQGVPVHGYPTLIQKLNTNEPALFYVKDIPIEFTLEKEMYKKSKTKAIACVPALDKESGLLLGFISVSWITEEVCPEDVVFPLLKMAAHQLATIVNIEE